MVQKIDVILPDLDLHTGLQRVLLSPNLGDLQIAHEGCRDDIHIPNLVE